MLPFKRVVVNIYILRNPIVNCAPSCNTDLSIKSSADFIEKRPGVFKSSLIILALM